MAGRLLLRANCWLNKLFCRSDVLGDPVVVARFDVRMFYGFAGNHIGLRIAEDEGGCIILKDFSILMMMSLRLAGSNSEAS